MNSMLSYEPFINECTESLLKQFDRLAESGEVFDLAWWLQAYAFDVSPLSELYTYVLSGNYRSLEN